MEKKEILRASQFIKIVERDLHLSIAVEDVHLGRLSFEAKDMKKDNGYICFYTQLQDDLIYVKAFMGKTKRCAKKISNNQVSAKSAYRVGDGFRAFDTTNWYYVRTEDEVLDYEIVDEYRRRQKDRAVAVK